MNLVYSPLPDCHVLAPDVYFDHRGELVKTYQDRISTLVGSDFVIAEEFFSISKKNVIRGMHFQLPPYDHDKLVYCIKGAVTDVLLDLRAGNGYGEFAATELSETNRHLVFIPKGIAHGFVSRSDEAIMIYKTNSLRVAEYESGILWNSFGFDWPIKDPVMSERDQKLELFALFATPYK